MCQPDDPCADFPLPRLCGGIQWGVARKMVSFSSARCLPIPKELRDLEMAAAEWTTEKP